jgi:IS5 family transposase
LVVILSLRRLDGEEIRCAPGNGGTARRTIFRAWLDQIVDVNHALAKLGRSFDWRFLEERFGAAYSDKAGHPPLPTRLMAGLSILKYMHDLSGEELCARWVENPYYQLFCGEEFFQHKLTFDRSSLMLWRQRMGEERLAALVQESLSVATRGVDGHCVNARTALVTSNALPRSFEILSITHLLH